MNEGEDDDYSLPLGASIAIIILFAAVLALTAYLSLKGK